MAYLKLTDWIATLEILVDCGIEMNVGALTQTPNNNATNEGAFVNK